MTKSKNTKRALLMSVLSMMLCIAMLAGSTFAWFTDSVTSGKNRIVAGNLDVELYYMNASTNDWKDASEANDANPNFFVGKDGKDILWEPGVMAVTQFKVANVGSLALKYSLETIKADFNSWNGNDLSDVIKFAFVGGTKTYETRDEVLADKLTFDDFTSFTAHGWLLPKNVKDEKYPEASDEKIFTVVAYWEPNVKDDNLYNVNNGAKLEKKDKDGKDRLYIDIEISLVATQYTYEEDSFDNQYDYIDGVYQLPAFSVSAPVVTNEDGDIRLSKNGVTAVIPAADVDPDADSYRLDVKPSDTPAAGVVVNNGQQHVGYDIHVMKIQGDTETPVAGAATTFEIPIGKGFYAVEAYHNGALIPSAYNAATGVISFAVDSFSPFDFVISPDQSQHAVALICSGDTAVTAKNSNELRVAIANAAAGSTVILLDDIVMENTTEDTESTIYKDKEPASLGNLSDMTFDGNGHTITAESGKYIFCDVKNSTVKNVTLALNGETPICWTANATLEKVVTKGEVSVSGNQSAFVVYAWLAPLTMIDCVNEATISGSSYNSVFVGYPYGADLTFRNCINKGSLVGDYSAMFIANPAGSIANTITIENCRNEGLIHTITTTKYIPNLFAAVSASLAKHTVVLDGVTYTGTEVLSLNTAELGMGNPISFSQEDPTLAVARNNAERTFVVTLASELDVAEYVLQYITYPKNGSGTQKQVISERFAAPTEGETYVSKVRYFDFVDSAWVENNPSAVQSTLDGHTIYTLNGMTYYLLPNPDGAYFPDHIPNPGDVCQLDAYNAAGIKIASVSFTITSGEISSKK